MRQKVFLLSVATFTDTAGNHIRRSAAATVVAKSTTADNCSLYVYDKGVDKDYIIDNGKRKGCSWWWTRTQAQAGDGKSSRAAFIGPRSNIKTYGRVDISRYGVRPALQLVF